MKKILFLLHFSLSLLVFGQEVRTYDIKYNIKDFSLITLNDVSYIASKDIVLQFESDTLSPALPFVSIKILIGPDEEVTAYDYSFSQAPTYQSVDIGRNLLCMNSSERIQSESSSPINYSKYLYPDSIVRYYGVHSSYGYRYACFMLSPFSYYPAQGGLYLNNISITLSLERKKEKREIVYGKGHIISQMVINPEDIVKYYSENRAENISHNNEYDYIIVTCDSLKDIFQKLALWKTIKGIRTKVITVEDIYIEDTIGGTNHEKIKRSLATYYKNGQGCQYVLLGGDVNVIPAFKCHVRYDRRFSNGNPIITTNSAMTDLYYGSYNNISWDNNNNYYNGEIADSIDLSPSVSIARLPIQNRSNAYTLINRILNYELGVRSDNWKNNILLFGANTDSFIYLPYKSISQYFCDSIYCHDISNSGVDAFRFYDTDTDYPTGSQYDLNAERLQSEMEGGYHFIYNGSHGFHTYWALENSYYDCEYAEAFDNPFYSHIVSDACYTNDISTESCLSKSFFKNPHSGLLSYFGSSVQSWISNIPFAYIASHLFSHTFYKELFTDNIGALDYKRLGNLVKFVKQFIVSNCAIESYEQPYRWLLCSMNILGEPEMPLYTSVPQRQTGITCEYNDGILSLQTPYIPGNLAEICIMSLGDNGASYYYRSSICYNCSYNLPSGDYSVCITHPNSIPYIAYVGDDIYIQDENIIGNTDVFGDNVIIGSDVTSSKPQGPVIIRNGNMNIRLRNGVTIQNDFEVKQGAQLIIGNDNN